jgi:Family of unknown function (DUF6152)
LSARKLSALIGAAVLLASGQQARSHHSFAVFDIYHPIELSGTVQAFKFVSPHAFIFLEVKDGVGNATVWTLEGASPSTLIRDGWSSQTLKSGDQIMLSIDPLRSGSPGGAWNSQKVNYHDGRPVVCCATDGF